MILLGLKRENASGTFEGTEGLQGISMAATTVKILKEGTEKELRKYVTEIKKNAKKAHDELRKLEDELEFSTMSEEKYDKLSDKYTEQINLAKFDKFIIVEGVVL